MELIYTGKVTITHNNQSISYFNNGTIKLLQLLTTFLTGHVISSDLLPKYLMLYPDSDRSISNDSFYLFTQPLVAEHDNQLFESPIEIMGSINEYKNAVFEANITSGQIKDAIRNVPNIALALLDKSKTNILAVVRLSNEAVSQFVDVKNELNYLNLSWEISFSNINYGE